MVQVLLVKAQKHMVEKIKLQFQREIFLFKDPGRNGWIHIYVTAATHWQCINAQYIEKKKSI